MSYKIIVARYNENIDWLKDEMQNCIIFNKGETLHIENEIHLENIGRESESYLHYIIENYYNLPDVIIFTQGNIADHRGNNDVSYIMQLKNDAFLNGKSSPFDNHFDNGEDSAFKKDWNFNNSTGNFFLQENYKNNTPILFIDWFKKYIRQNYPNPISIYTNAIFAVSKECILKKSIEYYKELILHVNHHINPTEGHFLERSWFYIFSDE
jgi:hypothetical protein